MHRFLNLIRTYRYELVAVADGMIVMMLELVGARLIAPHLGTSTYVWTAIIGVILGALALIPVLVRRFSRRLKPLDAGQPGP